MIHKYKIKVVAEDGTVVGMTTIHLSNLINPEEAAVLPLIGFRQPASFHEVDQCIQCNEWFAGDLLWGRLCPVCLEKEGEVDEDD